MRIIFEIGEGSSKQHQHKASANQLSVNDAVSFSIGEWRYAIASIVLVVLMVSPVSGWLDSLTIVQKLQSMVGTLSRTNTSSISPVALRVLERAHAWVGRDFKPGEGERCADFVRNILTEAQVEGVGVTNRPWDAGKQPNNGELMARSFFGSDIGKVMTDQNQFLPGDLIGLTNTYGSFATGAITHVGIYVGNGEFIDRSTRSEPVRQRNIRRSFPNSRVIAVRPHVY